MSVPASQAWFPLGGQSTVAHSSSQLGIDQTVVAQSSATGSSGLIFASTGLGLNPYTAPPTVTTAPSTEAVARSMELLYDWMNEDQRRQWATRSYFDVIGGDSGRRYRIYPPMPFNVHRLCKDSEEPDWKICFEPKDKKLPKGDILLCQKLALELDEEATLEVANQQVYHAW